jgi:triacylglycerol esterase/lipase EstA (alpha/beta hydrolase family)
MTERYPVVLIHGYSDEGKSFAPWKVFLESKDYKTAEVSVANYESLTNEVTLKDIAEGFDRALRTQAHLSSEQPFSAIVHSTGMLVIRSWLTTMRADAGD